MSERRKHLEFVITVWLKRAKNGWAGSRETAIDRALEVVDLLRLEAKP